MASEETLPSLQNLEKLEQLWSVLGLTGIRLMIDPEKSDASAESVIEDLCRLMEYKVGLYAQIDAGTWVKPTGARDNCYPKF